MRQQDSTNTASPRQAGDTSFPLYRWLPALAALACAACGEAERVPGDVRLEVEALPLDLVGAWTYYEQERRGAMPELLAEAPPDVLCLSNVMRDEDKAWLAEQMGATFPHAYWRSATLSDRPGDPTDQSGLTPPVPTSPPCNSTMLEPVSAAVSCGATHCSTKPGDMSGSLTSMACITSKCLAEFAPLLLTERRGCFSCMEAMVTSYYSFQQIYDRCTGDVMAGLAFEGTPDTMVLSRHPIDTTRADRSLLPSSLFRRQVLLAPVVVDGVTIDVYCFSVSTPYEEADFVVHPGPYGGGATGKQAWVNEVLLQAQKVVAFVQERSENRPAIVAGVDETSLETRVGGELLVAASPAHDGWATYDEVFDPAVPPEFVPACTACPENPLSRVSPPGFWTNHIWLHNIDASRVEMAIRTRQESSIQVPAIEGVMDPGTMSASGHYGFRSAIRVPRGE